MIRWSIALAFLLATMPSPVAAQDGQDDAEPAPAAAAETTPETAVAEADDAEDEEIDDADLDEQTYEEDEDDFVPSEEIPADEPIPFPSNI